MSRFYLGTHKSGWLGTVPVSLFVSRRTLAGRRALPRALAPWGLDSGGFTELSTRGAWSVSPRQYIAEARRFASEVGHLSFAAPQDWMCEPHVLAQTKLSIEEHQRRTIASYLELSSAAPDIPWIPVLQGWHTWSYFRCADLYARAGVDLARLPLVGVGSICRRQGTAAAGGIIESLTNLYGLRLHGFGVKRDGLRTYGHALASADSMAWSFSARRDQPLPGHPHKNCANCLEYALWWRGLLPQEWITEGETGDG